MTDKDPNPTITDALRAELEEQATPVEHELSAFHSWMSKEGKNPERQKSLSPTLSRNYHSRIDQILRFVLDRIQPSDKTEITHDQADLIVKWLDRDEIRRQNGEPYSEGSKRKFANALAKYFDWRHREFDAEQWRPRISFSDGEHESADKLNFEERFRILQEANEYGSLPSYYETAEEEREKINGLIAQRLGKPKENITSKDWERADTSTKIGSLVGVGLETGIIPIEVGRARTSWYKPKRNVLKIPKAESGKDRPTAELPLTEETGERLSKWIQERRLLEKYDGSDLLWLNREGNPYDSANLCYLVRRLCEEAGIEYKDRKIIWYSLRHNLGQSIEETEDISQASDQLRHDSIETTKKTYGTSTIESRRHTLERINEAAERSVQDPDFNPYADSNPSSSQHPNEESDTSGSTGHKQKHINVHIEDTQEERVDLVQKILSDDI
jgi:integrase